MNFEQTMAKILSVILQISQQLKEQYDIEDIDDIRIIRERYSSMTILRKFSTVLIHPCRSV